MSPPRTLVFAALPFGFGPASKALAVARALRGDAHRVFVGRGSALELVAREPSAFDEVVDASPAVAARRIAGADAVLSVMDREAASAAVAAGVPLCVLDSLLHLRREVPPAFLGAHVLLAQAFPGLDPDAYRPRPVVVGPVVAPAGPARDRDGLVVHLGGSAAPEDRRALYVAYARRVLDAVVAAGLPRRFGRVTVLAGAAGLEAAAGRSLPDARLEVLSVGAVEARARMAGAAAALSPPGLTTLLEAATDGTPLWLLPPQNHSQWLTLARLRPLGLASDALAWTDLPGVRAVAGHLPTEGSDPEAVAAIAGAVAAPEAVPALAARLRAVGDEADARVARQRAFLASLGPPGLPDLLRTVRDVLRGRDRVVPPSPAPRPERLPPCTS